MYRIHDLRIFEEIIYQSKSKKIILCGKDDISDKIFKILNLLDIEVDYYIDTLNNKTDTKNIYDLLYEDMNRIYIILSQNKEKATAQRLKLIDILGEKNVEQCCLTLYNNGGFDEWDIDINLGFVHKKQYKEFVVSNLNSDQHYTIVTLGGSTTDCQWEWQIKSWSELLKDKFLNSGINLRILCGGICGYSSSQEVVKFIRDISNLKPDMVISYSGVNDTFRMIKKHPFVFPHFKMLLDDMQKIYGENMKSLNYGVENDRSYSQQWVDNMQIMNELSKIYNIKFRAFLQPVPGVSAYKPGIEEEYYCENITEETTIESLNDRKKVYENIEKNIINKDYIINLTNIFDDEEDIYYDHAHVYERGNQIIADNIYKHIKDYVYNKK